MEMVLVRKSALPSGTVGLLGVMYAVIACNFVGTTFPCDLQRALTHSSAAKHIVLLLGAIVWVSEAYDSAEAKRFDQTIMRGVALYILFILSTKCQAWTLFPMLGIIVADQILRIYTTKAADLSPETRDRLTRWRSAAHYACVALIIGGAVSYGAKQMREHSDTFSWLRFFFDATIKCRDL